MQNSTFNWWKIMLWVAVVIATLSFMYAARSIILPFLVAFLITVLLEPTIQKLRRKGLSQNASILIVFVLFFGALGVGLVYAAPRVSAQVTGFSSSLRTLTTQLASGQDQTVFTRWNPVERARATANTNPVDQLLTQYQGTLEKIGIPANRRALVQQYVEPHRERIAKYVQGFFSNFVAILASAGSQFFMFLFTPLFVWLMLSDWERIKVNTAGYIPNSIRAETISLVRDVGQVFLSYLRGVTITICVYTVMSAILLGVLGVPYAILLALLAGALYLIPIFGSLISTVSVLLITGLAGVKGNFLFTMADPWSFAVAVTVVFWIASTIYDQLINPRLVGGSVGLGLLTSMFVVFSGGAIFGIVGMVLAFPVAGAVKVILQRILRVTSSTSTEDIGLPSTPFRHRTAGEI